MNEIFDVAIIGCGVTGANIARRLSAYQISVAVLEKETDVSFGTSKANSGIIHGGFHHAAHYLKTKLELKGALMFDQLQRELHFPFRRCGILVAALHEDELRAVQQLWEQGRNNGVIGLELCSRNRMLELESQLSPDVVGGLYAPGGGIIEPYRFVFALVESAAQNGVQFFTTFHVQAAERHNNGDKPYWSIHDTQGRKIDARYVVNAAGLYADKVSAIFAAEEFSISARKGEYWLMDRQSAARPSRVVFPVPSSVSKGMLVIPTVEDTILVGPTADSCPDKENLSTSMERLEQILDSGRRLIPGLRQTDIITSFAGLRPVLDEDFYIAASTKQPGLIQAAGIQSPGLTASPAIAELVKDLLRDNGLVLTEKPAWQPELPIRPRLRGMPAEKLDALIAKDPAWGTIVCRCEQVSEAEIVAAIRAGHTSLDGIKFYTRAQMGRCQGGFCTHKILKLIHRETGIPMEDITKHGSGSRILEGSL